MGRLWQSLILSKWQPLFAHLPVETVVYAKQENCYQTLGACDKAGDSTLFIEFMLGAIKEAMEEVVV
jgi:Fic family protein